METTRTSSPYFSPKSARAPDSIASSTAMSLVTTGSFWSSTRLAISSTLARLRILDGLGMAEVEAQAIGRHERALLGHVIAEHLAQRLVQQMGCRVVGAHGRAALVIDDQLQRLVLLQASRAPR